MENHLSSRPRVGDSYSSYVRRAATPNRQAGCMCTDDAPANGVVVNYAVGRLLVGGGENPM